MATVEELFDELGTLRLPRKYVPVEPHAKQEWFLRCPEFEVFFGGAAGPGKAESVTNEIPTTDGWRLMAEIEPGDYVFDAEGQPRCVLAVGPIQFKRPCMEVTFSDGATVVCDEQHEWMTLTYLERARASRRTEEFRSARRAKRESRALGLKSTTFTESLATRNRDRTYDLLDPPEPQVRETRELAETTMHRGRVNHSIPVAAPLVLPDVELPIDPYTLGVWLGDGYRNGGVIANDPRDDAIIQEIPYSSWRTPSNQLAVRVEGLTAMLRVAGLYGDKHIPTAYLRASAEQRLAVLQGIVDTDGHVDLRDGRVEITLTRWRLIESLCELVASLGIRFTVNESRATLDGRDVGPRWRVAFQTGLQVARLPRKRDAQHRGPFRRWHDHRYIVSVRRVPSVPVRCITVEGGIYLTGRRMIPTHNSWALLMAALQYVDVADYHALLFRPTLTEFEQQGGLIELSHKWLGPTDAAWNGTKREWRFPSRASVRFGYLRTQAHLSHYPGGGVSFLGFDELTLFTEQLYLGVFRLLRQALGGPLESVPLRVRGASNPGNVGHCVPYGDVLTPLGWRPIEELQIGAPVYAVDAKGELRPSKVEQVHRSTEEVITVEGRGLHMAVTPGHRVAKVGGTRQNRGARFSLVPFEELPGQATILRSVSWHCEPLAAVTVERPEGLRRSRVSQPAVLGPEQYARLLGWFLTEGCLIDRDYAISITQTKPDSRERLRSFLEDDCGFTVSWSAKGATIYAASWWQHLSRHAPGKCRTKAVPNAVKNAPPEVLAAFLEAAMDGDGHWCKAGSSGAFYSFSRQLADDFAEIAVKLGYIVHCASRPRPGREGLEHRVDIKPTRSGGTEILTGQHVYDVETVTKRGTRIERHPPTPVYCIGLPEHHAFVIRQRGSVWVSGNSWVKGRFISADTKEPDAVFVPASIRDNPSLDYETYVNTVLGHMHPVDRARLINGDWDVMEEGGKFRRADFQLIEEAQAPSPVQQVRYWDLAATEPSPSNPDPDWTVGLLYSADPDGGFTIRDIAMTRSNDDDVETLVKQTAAEDGTGVSVYIEQDPGQAGKAQISNYMRRVLRGYPVHAGSTRILGRPAAKEVRAAAVAAAVGNGLVRLVRCRNHREFLGQCAMFPNLGSHDDCVDALSGAHNAVTMRGGATTISVPRRRFVQPDRNREALSRQYSVG